MSATLHIGDTRELVKDLETDSIDLVLTSPPFLALRSYLPSDDPAKHLELGQEANPGEFIQMLLELVALWARPLAQHGSICVELGDTYAGSGGGAGGNDPRNLGKGDGVRKKRSGQYWPDAKSLCFIPELFGASLAYGRNLITGEESPAGQWLVRNTVKWVRANPPVGALGDKYRPASSLMLIATRAKDRWFDLDAVRSEPTNELEGSPPLDWWHINSRPYTGSHFAVWPPDLLVTPILSMCPQKVCTTCGEPSRRLVETEREMIGRTDSRSTVARQSHTGGGPFANSVKLTRNTTGWSDCGHDSWRNGTVLDPFAGSGTTLAVAHGQGRDAIGFDLDSRNADLCRDRLGMFLDVVE